MYQIATTDAAKLDIDERTSFYSSISRGIAADFVSGIDAAYQLISSNPLMFGEVRAGVRAAKIGKFQDVLYYSVEGFAVIVFALLHGRRHPKAWRRRFKAL